MVETMIFLWTLCSEISPMARSKLHVVDALTIWCLCVSIGLRSPDSSVDSEDVYFGVLAYGPYESLRDIEGIEPFGKELKGVDSTIRNGPRKMRDIHPASHLRITCSNNRKNQGNKTH